MDKGPLVVRGEIEMLDWPEDTRLIRWWVKGKPLAAGDEVSVQVLYTEAGFESFAAPDELKAIAPTSEWPALQRMLSNRLTFRVTKGMLKER